MRDTIRTRARRVTSRLPSPPPASSIALVVLYATMFAAAVAVGVGATAFVDARVGPYAAVVVGGSIAFAAAYVGIRVVDDIRNGGRK